MPENILERIRHENALNVHPYLLRRQTFGIRIRNGRHERRDRDAPTASYMPLGNIRRTALLRLQLAPRRGTNSNSSVRPF
jgi:hypothetical protein